MDVFCVFPSSEPQSPSRRAAASLIFLVTVIAEPPRAGTHKPHIQYRSLALTSQGPGRPVEPLPAHPQRGSAHALHHRRMPGLPSEDAEELSPFS
jgi:hypothetical protein